MIFQCYKILMAYFIDANLDFYISLCPSKMMTFSALLGQPIVTRLNLLKVCAAPLKMEKSSNDTRGRQNFVHFKLLGKY